MNKSKLQRDVFTQLLSLIGKTGITPEQLLNQSRINGMPPLITAYFQELRQLFY